MLTGTYLATAGSLSDPAGSSVILAALSWLQGTLLGTVATSVAITAVAWAGMLMLAGRLEIRRGLTTIAGCFVLFGAASIAGGIQGALGGPDAGTASIAPPVAPPVPAPPVVRNPDPYAGASVPGR